MLHLEYKDHTTEAGKAHNETITASMKQYKAAKAALVAAYEGKDSPAETVKTTIEAVGYEMTEAVISSLVHGKAWDGRISERNAKWAETVEKCLDGETASLFRLYADPIHPAHLDQIADAMRKEERPEEPKMNPNKNTIQEIEAMTEAEAMTYAEGREEIKGYNLYFVDFGGHYGLSVLVYGNGKMIRWACDFELHHKWRGVDREELKKFYSAKVSRQLFTEKELSAPLADYHDYERRRRFISELFPLRFDHLSIFGDFRTEEKRNAYRELQEKEYPHYSPFAFAYFKDAEPVEKIARMIDDLCTLKEEAEKGYEYMKAAFKYELGNHEYHINSYQGDWDTLSAFGNIKWHGQGAEARLIYYKELDFSPVQIKAFEDARKEFLKEASDKNWY